MPVNESAIWKAADLAADLHVLLESAARERASMARKLAAT